jgi:GH25 family lysozyme M1 (1,4-beta-N-acetylmuramidase)
MNQPYQLLLDVWEGSYEITEAELVAGNVAGLLIRINETAGYLHKDDGFDKQWLEAGMFPVRVPYFVHDPWVTPMANMDFLTKNMPAGCKAVAIDTELSPARWGVDYPAAKLGAEYGAFLNLCKEQYRPKIYTGKWFLEYLTPWPKDIDYWWSQYPFSMYPAAATRVSWLQLQAMISLLPEQPMNAAACPGPIRLWQCSGDRLILPGTLRTMDVNVFRGTLDDLKAWLEYDSIPVPIPDPTPLHPDICPTCKQKWPQDAPPPVSQYPAYKLLNNANVRSKNDSTSSLILPIIPKDAVIYVDTYIPGQYSHFQPNTVYPAGGFVATSFIVPV